MDSTNLMESMPWVTSLYIFGAMLAVHVSPLFLQLVWHLICRSLRTWAPQSGHLPDNHLVGVETEMMRQLHVEMALARLQSDILNEELYRIFVQHLAI